MFTFNPFSRTSYSTSYRGLNLALLHKIKEGNPSIFYIWACMTMPVFTLFSLKVAYGLENPLSISCRSSRCLRLDNTAQGPFRATPVF